MTKISSMTALAGGDVDQANDLLPVVDMSETGAARNKKITVADLLGLAFSNEAVDDRVSTLLTAGSNITLTYDDVAGTLTITAASVGTGDIAGFNEAVDDRVGALIDAGAGISVTYNDAAGTIVIANTAEGGLAMDAEWAPNWTGDADWYVPARVAMTIDQGNAAIGTGTIAFEKSTAAAPDTFVAASLPVTLEAGAWLKVSATGVSGHCATHLVRTD